MHAAALNQLLLCVGECTHVKELLLKGNDIKDKDEGAKILQKLNQLLEQRQQQVAAAAAAGINA